MKKTLKAVFDGKVLRPEEPVDLEPNAHYLVTVERAEEKPMVPPNRTLRRILERATDLGVSDFAKQHEILRTV